MIHHIYIHNYHLDGYGHVNNARYLEFLEETRWQFFRYLGWLDELRQANLVVSRMDIQYRHAIVRDDEVEIHTKIQEVQSRKIQLQQTIIIQKTQKLAALADVTLVPTQMGKIVRLSDKLLNQMNEIMNQQRKESE